MTARPSRAATCGLLLAAAAVLTACTGGATHAPAAAGSPVAPAGSAATAVPAADTSCGDATASLRPPATLPAPGAMPAGSFMATIAARGRLIVGTSQDTLLFSSRNPFTGEVEGFDIDTARLVAQAIFGDPNKIQIVVIPNSARIPDVQKGTVDLVAETMTVNCARDKLVDFSTVYYDAGQRILVPSTSRAASLADLGGKTVCAAAGSTSIDAIKAATQPPDPADRTQLGRLPRRIPAEPRGRDLHRRHHPRRPGRPGPVHEGRRTPVHRRAVRPGDQQEPPRVHPVRQRGPRP